jgi:surfeit locus 1 family protein
MRFSRAGIRKAVILGATVVGMLVAARLGLWQLDRADQKRTLQAALDSRASLPPLKAADLPRTPSRAGEAHFRLVHLQGQWLADRTVFLDNRQMNGWPGFYMLTPLQLANAQGTVLVQRGWVARDNNERTRLPAVVTPTGLVNVVGVLAPPPARLYEFAVSVPGLIRQNLDLASYAAEIGRPLLPFSVLQTDAPDLDGNGLLRQWPRPGVDIHKNYGYAFQWFALGTLIAGLYVWFQLLRPKLRRAA